MIGRDVIKQLAIDFPAELAMEWDNVGLLAGRREKVINHIFIALDADDEVIQTAVDSGADLLLTHHPLLFSPVSKITDEHFITKRVVKLLQHDLSYYALHTNYDVLRMGSLAGTQLGFEGADVLMVTHHGEKNEGIGCVTDLSEAMRLDQYGAMVKKVFHLDGIRLFGDPKRQIRRIAVSPGSGKGMIEAAIEKGADVLITGDIGHHEGIDANARGLAVIDAGHYGMEHLFIKDMERYIKETFPHITVNTADIKHPFMTM